MFKAILRVFKSVREYKKYAIITPLFMIGEAAVECFIPYVMTLFVAKIKTNPPINDLIPYFIILIAIIVVFAVALIIYKRINKFNQNQVLVRNKKATKIAKKRLQNAYSYLKIKDQNHFYEELSQALWGYISDKLNIARSQLSMDTVKETMTSKNVPEDIVNQFIDLLNSCEYARFAPGDPGKKMDDLYQKGIEVITKAEKNL